MLRRTKILCTLGPASSSRKIVRSMIDAGMDAVRLNFSHGSHASHDALIENVRKAAGETGRPIPIILDLQGPRFRVGDLGEGYIDLKRGEEVILGKSVGSGRAIPIRPSYPFRFVKKGHRITIGDLGIALKVVSAARGSVVGRVTKGGTVHPGKGVGFPDSQSGLPALTAKDIRDLHFGISRKVTYVALSFVRSADNIAEVRRLIGRHEIGVISKIETKEALRNIDAIIDHSDAVLVARGDLAAEVSMSRVPLVQKVLISKCRRMAKPVITATQMLESMITNPQPTRAEASDVANAVLDGTDVVMLSGETTIGAYPIETVKMMDAIVRRTETASRRDEIGRRRPLLPAPQIDETIAYLAATAAQSLKARAIITFTISGSTALRVAKFRPEAPIFAVSPSEATRLKLCLSHGTVCGDVGRARSTDEMLRAAIAAARKAGIVGKGDIVVVTAGVPVFTKGKTNLLKMEVV